MHRCLTRSLGNRMWLLAAAVTALALPASPTLAQSIYEPYAFTTLAGLAGSTGSSDGIGSFARFAGPAGVAVDGDGNIYVTDPTILRKVTPTGEVTTLAGRVGYYTSVDGTGSAAGFKSPSGVAVDGAGNVYVAELGSHTIRKVTPGGVVTTLAGLGDSQGSADGTGSIARFNYPSGLAVDSTGNLYVADYSNHTIRKVTLAGKVTTLAGLAGSQGSADGTGSAARFNYPEGLAVDSTGNLYVSDRLNCTIRRVTPTGEVTTLAGAAGVGGSADWTGSAARFGRPSGVTVDGAGNVYVADQGNSTIRKGFPAGASVQFASPSFDGVENAGFASIAVTLAGTYTNQVTVDFATSNGTATTGLDYTATNGTLTFLPGQTTATFTVTILNDGQVEGPETVNLTLSNPTGSPTLGGPTHVLLTIVDNDMFTLDSFVPVYESAGAATVRVTRSGDLDATVTAVCFTSDGPGYYNNPVDCPGCPRSAIAGVDYAQEVGILTFGPGETNQVFTVPILDNGRVDDYRVDAYRSFTVTVFSESSFQARSEIGIQDNEVAAQMDPGFSSGGFWGEVYAMALQPDGRILLGGTFDHVADIACTNLARLNPDGSLDASFAAATSLSDSWGGPSQVSVLKLTTDGQVLVAGTFKAVNGVPMNGLARLSADGSWDPGFNAFSGVALSHELIDAEGAVAAGARAVLVQPDGKIVIGGVFDTVNGVGRTNLARLNADGSLDTSFVAETELTHYVFGGGEQGALTEAAARVFSLALQPDGKILVGGTFVTVNGADRGSIARLNPDGTLDNTFFVGDGVADGDNPGSVNSIIAQPDGAILIAGQFTSVHGVGRDGLARLYAHGGLDTQFDWRGDGPFGRPPRFMATAVTTNGGIWVAASDCSKPGCFFRVDRLNPDGSPDGGFPQVSQVSNRGWVTTMAVQPDGDVLVGGWLLARYYGNPSEPRVQFDSAGIVVNELSGMATVTVQRLGDTSNALTVDYTTSDGTARAGLNYVATSGTLSFAPLEVTKMISIPILDDHAFSSDLSFRMTLSHPSVGLLGLNPLTITVRVSNYTPYTFSTLAGLGGGGAGSADGTGSAARFSWPLGVTVDGAGNLYVADFGNNAIRKVTPAGVVTTLAGQPGSAGSSDGTGSAARFQHPSGVAVDDVGNLYVADLYNYTIRKVTPADVVITLAGQAGSSGSADGTGSNARFAFPSGVAVDSAKNVYVADQYNHTIRKVTPVGVVTTLAGRAGYSGSTDGTGSGARFYEPLGVAVDSAGDVYVADRGNHTIRKVTASGVVTTLAGPVQFDSFGNRVTGSADGTGSAALFNSPSGVAVDSTGNIYVADVGNHTIRKVTPAGIVTTLAGLAGNTGSTDGTGSAARFSYPNGVAVDSAGNVYVADKENQTIRRGFLALGILSSGPGFGFDAGRFGFVLTGPMGRLVVVEASDDLADWLPISTNTFTGGLPFTDPQSGAAPQRFYRVRSP